MIFWLIIGIVVLLGMVRFGKSWIYLLFIGISGAMFGFSLFMRQYEKKRKKKKD